MLLYAHDNEAGPVTGIMFFVLASSARKSIIPAPPAKGLSYASEKLSRLYLSSERKIANVHA